MRKMEVFFDYACPYCLRAHEALEGMHARYPDVEIIWQPCEAHPRPERHGPHSDLCIQGMFFARDHGVDLWAYHERMYRLALKDGVNIEDVSQLACGLADLLDAEAFRSALLCGQYDEQLRQANAHAYERSGVWAVPAYRLNGRKLDAVEGVGVTARQLEDFLNG